MINDKMDVEEIILDLSTRATNLFARGDDTVSVAFQAHKSIPGYWLCWLDYWIDGSYWFDARLNHSLSEESTLRSALINLDYWLEVKENKAISNLLDGERIVESIGFGD